MAGRKRQKSVADLLTFRSSQGVPDAARPERYRVGPRSFMELRAFLLAEADDDVKRMWAKAGSLTA